MSQIPVLHEPSLHCLSGMRVACSLPVTQEQGQWVLRSAVTLGVSYCWILSLDPGTNPAVNGPLYILLNVYMLEEGQLWTKHVLRRVIPWCPVCVPTKFNCTIQPGICGLLLWTDLAPFVTCAHGPSQMENK